LTGRLYRSHRNEKRAIALASCLFIRSDLTQVRDSL
jgi:hypothetical protein